MLYVYMCVCLTLDQLPLRMWHTSYTPVPYFLDNYVHTFACGIWMQRVTELKMCVDLIAVYLCEAKHDTIYSHSHHMKIWGEQIINVTYVQEYIYNAEFSGWIKHPPKQYVSGLDSLKVFHDLDKKMVVAFRRMNSYQVPRAFMDGALNAKCQASWSRVYDGIVRSGTISCIPVGSCVEGGVLCRMFSSDPDCDVMDLDQLHVLDNLCFTDYNTTFGPSPANPGWYWVNKDVMCPRLTNIDGYVNIYSNTRTWSSNKHYDRNDVTFKYHMKRSGPALTRVFNEFDHTNNCELKRSTDTVFACQLDFWPPEAADWLTRTRQWPSQDKGVASSKNRWCPVGPLNNQLGVRGAL